MLGLADRLAVKVIEVTLGSANAVAKSATEPILAFNPAAKTKAGADIEAPP